MEKRTGIINTVMATAMTLVAAFTAYAVPAAAVTVTINDSSGQYTPTVSSWNYNSAGDSLTLTISGNLCSAPPVTSECTYAFNPSSVSGVADTGGAQAVTVTATPKAANPSATCNWTAATSSSWITVIDPASGTSGATPVSFNIAQNTGAQRSGTIVITETATSSTASLSVSQLSAPGQTTYTSMTKNCGSVGSTGFKSVSLNTPYYYTFTIPQGTYTYIWAAYQQSPSDAFDEQLVMKKGTITKAEYDSIVQGVQSGTLPKASYGTNGYWYTLGSMPNYTGTTVGITGSATTNVDDPDIVRTITSRGTAWTFTKSITFTAIAMVGDKYPKWYGTPKDAVRYCTY